MSYGVGTEERYGVGTEEKKGDAAMEAEDISMNVAPMLEAAAVRAAVVMVVRPSLAVRVAMLRPAVVRVARPLEGTIGRHNAAKARLQRTSFGSNEARRRRGAQYHKR